MKSAGSNEEDNAWGIATTPSGDIYMTGVGGIGMSFEPTMIQAGVYLAKLSDSGACEVVAPELGADRSMCSGETINIGVHPQSGYTYEWFSNFSAVTGLSDPKASNPTFTYRNTLTVSLKYQLYLKVTAPNGCTASDMIEVTVLPEPGANAGPDKEACAGTSVTLGTSPQSGVSYSWTVSPAIENFSSTLARPTVTIPAGTSHSSYTFKVRTSKGGCSSEDEVTVTVSSLAAPVAEGGNRCGPGTVTLSASGAPNGGGYRWYTASAGGSPVATSASYTTPSLANTTVYYVSAVNSSGCESPRSAVAATITPLPAAVITTNGPTVICEGGSVALSAKAEAGYTYEWLLNGEIIEGATEESYAADRSGDYSARVTSGGCSVISGIISITTISRVSNNIISGSQAICAGQAPAVLTGSTPTGGTGEYVYSWEISTSSATVGFAPAPGAADGQNYAPASLSQTTWFRRTATSGGCSNFSEAVQVSVTSAVATPGTIQGNNSVCPGQSQAYSISEVAGATGYTWSVPNGFTIISGQGTNTISITAGTASGAIAVAANSTCGASSASSLNVTVVELPTVNAGPDQSVCADASDITLSGFSPAGGTWSGAGVTADGVFQPGVAGPGEHTVTYTVNQGGCTATASRKITIATCTGVNENLIVSSILVFPNPTQSTVQVEATMTASSVVTIKVLDVAGRLVHEKIINNNSLELKYTINLYGKTAGMYLLNITTEKGTIYRKILLK